MQREEFFIFAYKHLQILSFYDNILSVTRSGGMADATDSKSVKGNLVPVQVPPSGPAYEARKRVFFRGRTDTLCPIALQYGVLVSAISCYFSLVKTL